MRKVALIGNAAGGKSTLAVKLSASKGIPLYFVDKLRRKPGGGGVIPDDEFARRHDEVLSQDSWIIDGFGTYSTYLRRLEAADTIILIDHPIWRHYWWMAKRSCLSVFQPPVGFPENSPVIRCTIWLAKLMWQAHKNLTPTNRRMIAKYAQTKQIFYLRSPKDIRRFCEHNADD